MKRILPLFLAAALAFSLAGCGGGPSSGSPASPAPSAPSSSPPASAPSGSTSSESAPSESLSDPPQSPDPQPDGTLIVYFSRVGAATLDPAIDAVASASVNPTNSSPLGNNEILAGLAAELTGAPVFQIVPQEKYPADYDSTTEVARAELGADARPALETHVEGMDTYDTILLIYPIWWGTLPMPVYTFFEEYDFSGKTIAPLCTHEGSGLGDSAADLAALCPGATVLAGLEVRGSAVADAREELAGWLQELGLAQ